MRALFVYLDRWPTYPWPGALGSPICWANLGESHIVGWPGAPHKPGFGLCGSFDFHAGSRQCWCH